MNTTPLCAVTSKVLTKLMARLAGAMGETLGSLIGKELVIKPLAPLASDAEALLADLERPCAAARGALDKNFAGKHLLALFQLPDAITMTGLLMMTPEHVIAQRRVNSSIEGEDAEAFSELGNVLYSGLGNVLRDCIANIDVRMHDFGVIKPGVDPNSMLQEGQLVLAPFQLKIGDQPGSTGYIVLDWATAETWNKGPLALQDAGPAAGAPAATQSPQSTVPQAAEVHDELEDVPEGEIRGRLAAFVQEPKLLPLLRRCCRRVGLELLRHGRGAVPNPAAHCHELVLVDVPMLGTARLEWIRRLKERSPETLVLVLLHHATRHAVLRACRTKADDIVAVPCPDRELASKLEQLLTKLLAAAPDG